MALKYGLIPRLFRRHLVSLKHQLSEKIGNNPLPKPTLFISSLLFFRTYHLGWAPKWIDPGTRYSFGHLTLIYVDFIQCVLKTWNKTNGFHGHMMSHDVTVAGLAMQQHPWWPALQSVSGQQQQQPEPWPCHIFSFHPPVLDTIAPRAKQQSEAKVARNQ